MRPSLRAPAVVPECCAVAPNRGFAGSSPARQLRAGEAGSAAERPVGPDDDGICRSHAGIAVRHQDDIVRMVRGLEGHPACSFRGAALSAYPGRPHRNHTRIVHGRRRITGKLLNDMT